MQLVLLIEGVVVVESLFAWPGIGHALVHAIFWRDIPMVQGTVLVLAVLFVLLNTLTDLLCLAIDPVVPRSPDHVVVCQNGLGLLLLVVLFALLGPVLWPDPAAQDLAQFLADPSRQEPLGRDQMGRSLMAPSRRRPGSPCCWDCCASSRRRCWGHCWAGSRPGAAAGRRSAAQPGRRRLAPCQACCWCCSSPPWPRVALPSLYLGLAMAQWVEYYRVVRARSRGCLPRPRWEASRLLGFGHAHVVRRHLWPELAPQLLTLMMAFWPSGCHSNPLYPGLCRSGHSAATPELGLMMTEALPHYQEAPRLLLAPFLSWG